MIKKINPAVYWLPRYSDTMENDKQGRWARVAYAGSNPEKPFYRGKISFWEIAWIDKLINNDKLFFVIKFQFPSNHVSKNVFENLEEAKKTVEKAFVYFINKCSKKTKTKHNFSKIIELKIDKNTLPSDKQKVKWQTQKDFDKNEWKQGTFCSGENLFCVGFGNSFSKWDLCWEVLHWQNLK